MFALVDGNNFYASCERIFQPRLRGVPLVVLSNNDGCAIARTAEAKALGIRMGQPAHELKHLVKHQGLQMRSANFTLYGDISARVVGILRDEAPRVEVYSIDESFLDMTGIPDREQFAHRLRTKVHRWTGIPNCIGIGPTKTLAKAANKAAKSGAGVVDLTDPIHRAQVLASFPTTDLWGVGGRWGARLAQIGITTAAQLRDAPTDSILGEFGVTLARTQRELQGHSCIELEEFASDKQQIMVSRSFADRVEDHEAVAQALATFGARACEKLRRDGLVAGAVGIFAVSDRFRAELPQHSPSRTINMPAATGDSRLILSVVTQLLRGMLKPGIGYKKAGVVLMDLSRPEQRQGDLFTPSVAGNPKLMAVLDGINRKFGRGAAGLAATGWEGRPAWGMRQNLLSPHYTTRARDLPLLQC